MREWTIAAADAEQRLDKYLQKYFKAADKSFLYKMLRKKNITLNGSRVEGNERLAPGDTLRVFFSEETFAKMRGAAEAAELSTDAGLGRGANGQPDKAPHGTPDMPPGTDAASRGMHIKPNLSVLYEDAHILAMNKPAGLLSQKAAAEDISLNDLLIAYLKHENEAALSSSAEIAESELSLTFTPGIANRLDRNTSGLVLAGKTLTGQQLLTELLRRRELTKLYLCVVCGRFSRARTSRLYWTKTPDNTVDVSPVPVEGASLVELHARPLEYFADAGTGDHTLLEVHLISGKSHQIRAQLAYLGNPILGDGKYGNLSANRAASEQFGFPLRQQLLHAWSVEFPAQWEGEEPLSPRKQEAFEALCGRKITAPLPPQFARVLRALGSEKLIEL